MSTLTALACVAYLLYLLYENRRARTDRQALQHVIHVNGIRGKSSVSRLIDAGLRAGGWSVLTKTTGTCPAVIGVDGEETPLRRYGPANIREQLATLRRAVRAQADVLVLECMAVLPEYQQLCEERMLRADIAVITNVRLDHTEEMGATTDEIAEALSLTIPRSGLLFTAEEKYRDFFAQRAARRGSRVCLAHPADMAHEAQIDFSDNVALALAVCEHLGVSRERALHGMRTYRPDPGVFRVEMRRGADGSAQRFINALAANDPDSAARLLDGAEVQGLMAHGQRVLLMNNRYDRPARLRQFVDFAVQHQQRFDCFMATGSACALVRRMLRQRGIVAGRILRLSTRAGVAQLNGECVIFAVGNIVGTGLASKHEVA